MRSWEVVLTLLEIRRLSQELRSLGRMIKAAREMTTMKTIKDPVSHENFKDIIKVARHIVAINVITLRSEIPSLNFKFGIGLNNIAKYLKAEALQNMDNAEAELYCAFSTIYDSHCGVYMSDLGRLPSFYHLQMMSDFFMLHAFSDQRGTQHHLELKQNSQLFLLIS